MSNVKEIIKEAFDFRYACKEFEPSKKIPDEDFNFIIDTAILSPSSLGLEPWKFLIIQDPNIRQQLREVSWGAQGQLPTASHFILFAARKADDMRAGSAYQSHMLKEVKHLPEDLVNMLEDSSAKWQQNDFDLTDDRKIFDWSSKQSYIPLANIMTVAAMLKIDSCAIEGFNRFKVDEILEKAGVLDTNHFSSAVMLALGYRKADAEVFPKTRQTEQEVVKWV